MTVLVDPEPVRRATARGVQAEVAGPLVLVIDDNTTNLALARATLEEDGYRVLVATDAESGVAAFVRLQPQCILLDVMIPGLDGVAACRRIRALPGGARVAIVFVTALHDVATFDRALAAGGDDFMTKPYRPSELSVRVQTALRLRRVAHDRDELYELLKHQRDDLQRTQLQIRDANEKLVLASVYADELADAANAARAAATANEERFRTLMTTSSALIWQADASGHVQVDLATWRSFTGLDAGPGEWGWLAGVHPADREGVRAAWSSAVECAAPYEHAHRLRRRTGDYAWVLARAAPIPTTNGVREWIGMMTDISDRVRIDEARERFIGVLGHDLRNPLGAIMMGVELLSDVGEPHASVVTRIGRSAHRMERMIRDVLDFARGRLGGGIPIAPMSCDLAGLVRGVVDETQQAHPTRPIRFDSDDDLCGQWDPDRLEQLLSNLLGNAVTHGTGPILVTSHGDGDAVVTTVHNEGPPIAAELLATLFEPFTGTHRIDGLGLGLYIASEIAHAHGGTIAVSSVEGSGTTFAVRLPRRGIAPSPG